MKKYFSRKKACLRYIFALDSTALCVIMLAALILSGIISAVQSRENIRSSVVRLHILAESDSDYDQELKLKVRNGILAASPELFEPYSSSAEAEESLSAHLGDITNIAENVLAENGCYLPVTAKIEQTEFDERIYGDITMPAGEYTALRVEIGSGLGHNWWCVMYPPLCVPCAQLNMTDKEILEKYGTELTEEDISLLLESGDYEVRFYIIDKLAELFGD